MANVSANIGANTQQAESSIGRLLASLRKLRQESSTGVGMKMFASDEVNKLSTALNQAIAAAGALNKLDLSQFDQSLRRSAELLKRNADNYLRAQQAMGNQGVAGRFAQQLGAGGNPLNPNFGQMFPGMQGAALQRQMDFYFKSMLRGTGMSGSYSGGGGRGGTTGHGGAAPGSGGEGDGGGSTAILAGMGKMFAPILAAVSVGKLVSSGLAAARRNTEAEDTLMRMTRDGGTGAGIGRAGLRMDNQVGSLSEHFEFVGKRYGLSGTEAMQSAQVYAHAAQQNDRQNVAHGLNASAGFARAYGLNINQTAGGLGGLQRTGAIGNTQAAQNEFLLKMAQTLKSTGMTANADQAIDDLAQTVDQYISHDLATPNQGKLDEFAALRAVTYATPGLSGKHGQNLLGRFDENIRSDSNEARRIMMAVELQKYGINNTYTQTAVQAEGANFDLSTLPGWKGPKGMTVGELAVRSAHQTALENAGAEPSDRNSQDWTDWDNQVKTYESNLLNESIPGAHKLWEIYQQRDKDKAKLVDSKAQLARYGLTPEDFSNTSGVKDAVDLMGMDNPEDVREVAKRYADRLDMTGAGGAARADINKLLEDANSDPDAIKKRTLEAIAQFGQHGSQTTTDRASQAEQDNALNAVGRVFMDEWNTTVETGSTYLKEFARSTDGAKKALDGFKDWLNAMLATTPTEELPLGHTQPPEMGLPRDLPLMPGETQAERDAGGDVAPLRPFGSPPPGTGGGTPTTLPGNGGGTPTPLASTSVGEDLLNLLVPPANASVTPTPTGNWNTSPGTIPPDIANTSPMPKATGGTAASTTSLDATSGRVQARDIYDYLVNEKGVSPSKAVAMVTNIEAESGFKVDTVHDGGTGYGMFGHRDPNGKSGRRSALFEHAGTQTPSAKQQLDYALTESEYKQFAAVDNGGDHRADTASFTKIFESPKNENLRAQERAAKSDNYASYMGSGPAAPGDPTDLRALAQQRLALVDQSDPKRRDFSYDNLDPKFADNLKRFVEAGKAAGHGDLMDPISGTRGLAHQRRIKAEAVAAGKGHMAADEGKSGHGSGSAADLRYFKRTDPAAMAAKKWVADNADEFDMQVRMNDPNARTFEPWHIEPKGFHPSKDPLFGVKEAELRAIAAGKETPTTKKLAAKSKDKPPNVPKDTGGPEAKPPTVVASGKGGKLDTEVPNPANVAPTEKTQTPEEAAAKAAKDADAARQAKAASVPKSREEVSRLAAKQKPDTDSPAANPVQGDAAAVKRLNDGLKPNAPGADRPDFNQKPDTTPTGAPTADSVYANPNGSNPANLNPGTARPVVGERSFTPNPPAPGSQEVDPDAQKTIGATQSKNFGELQVNVNNYQNGVKQSSSSQTLKAGSGGADNSVKGAVNISPEKVA